MREVSTNKEWLDDKWTKDCDDEKDRYYIWFSDDT